MKIIGLMVTWNNIEFFRYALNQALQTCDEIILIEGCHSKQFPKHSTDGTVEYIKTIRNHPKLQVADFDFEDRYDRVQRQIRRDYPKLSRFYEVDNWIIHWDDDKFYLDADLAKFRTAIATATADTLIFPSRYFFYNFRFNFLQKTGIYIYKILGGFNVSGISNPYYQTGQKYSIQYSEDIMAFHYSYVKKPERMKARWVMSQEKNKKAPTNLFDEWMSVEWEKENDIFKHEKTLAWIRDNPLGFNIYKGKHPETLDNHPWRYIEDCRNL